MFCSVCAVPSTADEDAGHRWVRVRRYGLLYYIILYILYYIIYNIISCRAYRWGCGHRRVRVRLQIWIRWVSESGDTYRLGYRRNPERVEAGERAAPQQNTGKYIFIILCKIIYIYIYIYIYNFVLIWQGSSNSTCTNERGEGARNRRRRLYIYNIYNTGYINIM